MAQLKITLTDPRPGDFLYKEALKTLRANLQFSGKNNKVILVTSCLENEGKSDISFHLAVELANAGKRVLLIDFDTTRSVYVRKYGIEGQTNGLSQYLSGQIEDISSVVYRTNYPGMHMILAGPSAPNPSELLGDKSFEHLIMGARNTYEYVIIDTAPLGTIIDAAVVGQSCDGAVLVIENGAISYRLAQRVKQQLAASGCKVLGAVLNKVNIAGGRYGKYGYGKYGYGYGYDYSEEE